MIDITGLEQDCVKNLSKSHKRLLRRLHLAFEYIRKLENSNRDLEGTLLQLEMRAESELETLRKTIRKLVK